MPRVVNYRRQRNSKSSSSHNSSPRLNASLLLSPSALLETVPELQSVSPSSSMSSLNSAETTETSSSTSRMMKRGLTRTKSLMSGLAALDSSSEESATSAKSQSLPNIHIQEPSDDFDHCNDVWGHFSSTESFHVQTLSSRLSKGKYSFAPYSFGDRGISPFQLRKKTSLPAPQSKACEETAVDDCFEALQICG